MGFLDVARGVTKGVAMAGGNQAAVTDIGDQQAAAEQQKKFKLQQQIAPLGLALQGLKSRLTAAADPNDPTKALPGKEAEYNLAHDNMADVIGKMRMLMYPPPKEDAHGLSYLAHRATDKMHITNHAVDDYNQAQAAKKDTYDARIAQDVANQVQSIPAPEPGALTPQELHEKYLIAAGEKAREAPVKAQLKLYKIPMPDGTTAVKWLDAANPESIPADAIAAQPGGETEYQKAMIDLRQKSLDLQKARQDYNQDPHSIPNRTRLMTAQAAQSRAHSLATSTEARVFGTSNGVAVEGSTLSENDKPVGAMFSANVKPTGTEISRADLADSALEQIAVMKDIIKRRREKFGPGAGQAEKLKVWLGSQDEDAQKLRAAARIAGSHGSGVYGAKSKYSEEGMEKLMGDFGTNPDAASAGLDEFAQAFRTIQGKGVRHTTGGVHGTTLPMTNSLGGGKVTMKAPNGMTKQVDPADVAHYKALGAVVVQ